MTKAQSWLNKKFPLNKRSQLTQIYAKSMNLEGTLIIQDFPNLERIICDSNPNLISIELINLPQLTHINTNHCQLTEIKIDNCPNISYLNVANNLLTDIGFLTNLNPERLNHLSIHSNNFTEQDLSIFSKFINLEQLYLDNNDEDKFEQNIYNRWVGSLQPLQELTKLKWLSIANTNVGFGLEYLPESVKKIGLVNSWDQKDTDYLKIKAELYKSVQNLGVTEPLQQQEENEPDFVKDWYRLAPWHQAQNLLLEKKPLVQQLRKKLVKNEQVISDLKEKLQKEQLEHAKLQEQLDSAIIEEEKKESQRKDNKIRELEEQVRTLMTHINPQITISNINTNTNLNNQINIVYQIQDQAGLKKELAETKQKYQELETISEKQTSENLTEITQSDKQVIKKTIAFLGAKQIFISVRQTTINDLIDFYNKLERSNKKFDKLALVGNIINDAGGMVDFLPSAGAPVKLLGKGIVAVSNIFKSSSCAKRTEQFQNCLVNDEKAIFLLNESYQSLVNTALHNRDDSSKGKIVADIVEILSLKKYRTNPFGSEHSVFNANVSGLWKEKMLTPERMEETIKSLIADLQNFETSFQEEKNQYYEKVEKGLSKETRDLLQTELAQLENQSADLLIQENQAQVQIPPKN